MKVALITDGISPFVIGGMQKHSAFLAKYLTLGGCEVTLYHCVYNQEIPTKKEVNNAIFDDSTELYDVIGLQFPKSLRFPLHYLFNSYKYSKLIFNLVEAELDKFDFIYAKGFSAWKILKENKDIKNLTPIGVNFHGMNMFLPSDGIKQKLYKPILKKYVKKNMSMADYVFSYGGKVTNTINEAGIDYNKIIEIPTGIDLSWVVNKEKLVINDKLKFLFIGRNDPLKGLNIIFKYLKNNELNDCEFHFVGPIKKNVISNNIKYFGEVKSFAEMTKIIDCCDVLIVPSYSEGMPNVILEAMSRGLIILATNVGAISTMVSSTNGILIDYADYDLFSESISKILNLNHDSLLNKKKYSINKVVDYFVWDRIIIKLLKKLNVAVKNHNV